MFKYIKWELLSLGKKNLKFLLGIAILYGLVLILPVTDEGILVQLLYIPFGILISFFLVGTFLFGTIRVISTFSRKTFLLESMIAESPQKILLAKYLLAIILNVVCLVVAMIGVGVILVKAGEIEVFAELLKELMDVVTLTEFLKLTLSLFIMSTSFTAMVTMCYVIAKCLVPNGKGAVILGFIVWWVVTVLVDTVTAGMFEGMADPFWLSVLVSVGFILLYYFITVKLIENKLEIYN